MVSRFVVEWSRRQSLVMFPGKGLSLWVSLVVNRFVSLREFQRERERVVMVMWTLPAYWIWEYSSDASTKGSSGIRIRRFRIVVVLPVMVVLVGCRLL